VIRHSELLIALALCLPLPALASDPWTAPTPEELAMTSVPEVPGASAIYLYREQVSADFNRSTTVYVRIKILNGSGKDYANVELPFGEYLSYDKIAGRTIHSDGSIIPFTGKPFEKLIEKDHGNKYKVKIFSLPSVEVGSIIEYRYTQTGAYSEVPDWFIQSELFTRKAHYAWDSGGGSIAWTPILPAGVQVNHKGALYFLDIQNVPPIPKDEMMPPMESISYRVLFYSTLFTNAPDFWKAAGELWSQALDKFIGPGKGVRAAVANMVAPGDTDEQKLRKIYAAIMATENVDFTRKFTAREAKAKGFKDINSTDDILTRNRASGDQLALLFVSMARAAGLKAYVMGIADRSERIFLPNYLSFGQLDDYIAIVKLGGIDTYFDPGARYCPFGHLAWFHNVSGGLRQTDGGTAIFNTPRPLYTDNQIKRIANLTLDEQGVASGSVVITYVGDPARRWRETALTGDETSLKADLQTELEHELPSGMEITVDGLGDLTGTDKPLVITYTVHGAIGSSAGKRLLVPANLFQAGEKPKFPSEKRDVPIDMHYGSLTQDAVGYRIPASMTVESIPAADKAELKTDAAFTSSSRVVKDGIVLYRNVSIGRFIYAAAEYPDVREFYKKLEAKDQETLVLSHVAAVAKPAGSGN